MFSLNDVAFLAAVSAPALDPDAAAYIAAVEAADTQALEPAVRAAINDFVVGCKADGIWNAIKASCILAGARTLTGALVPLAGAAPTNFNFVSGDYDRKTGLVGDGSTKYLDTTLTSAFVPLNDVHLSVYHTESQSGPYLPAGTGTNNVASLHLGNGTVRCRTNGSDDALGITNGLQGLSRAASSSYRYRHDGTTYTYTRPSNQLGNLAIFIFAGGTAFPYPGRLGFWSYGESLDLALLDARVTALINAFAAAI